MNGYPDPCEHCAPYGGNHRLIEREGATVLDRCNCARGRMLKRADDRRENPPDPAEFRPTLSARAAAQAARSISQLIPEAPRGDEGITMLADEIMGLCRNVTQAQWLVKRLARLYTKWPGIREMRIVFCSRYMAADGADLLEASSHYPNGIPSERPAALAEAPKALPAGHRLTADGALEPEVQAAARRKRLTGPKRVIGAHDYTEDKAVNE